MANMAQEAQIAKEINAGYECICEYMWDVLDKQVQFIEASPQNL